MGKLFLIISKLRHIFLILIFISVIGYGIIIENNWSKNRAEIRDAIIIDYFYLERLETLFENDAVKKKTHLPKKFVSITGEVSSINDRYTPIPLGFNNKYTVNIIVRDKNNNHYFEVVTVYIKGRKNVNFLLKDDIVTVTGKLDHDTFFKIKVKRKDRIIVHDS